MIQTTKDIIAHPATVLTALLGALAQIASIGVVDALWSTIWGQAGVLFTALSISGLTLGPEIAFIPDALLTQLALLAGVIYVAKLADRFLDSFQARLEDDQYQE